jgi:hypothetical protein
MAIKDYSEEDDYYTQEFEKDGVVSIWVGLTDGEDDLVEFDVLQDLCGVGYYDLASQEGNCFDYKRVSLKELLDEMSYSNSFISEALKAAQKKGLSEGLWVTLQYDFEYDPARVERKISKDPVYLGSFNYKVE